MRETLRDGIPPHHQTCWAGVVCSDIRGREAWYYWFIKYESVWIIYISFLAKREKKNRHNLSIWCSSENNFPLSKNATDRISLYCCALGTNLGCHFVIDFFLCEDNSDIYQFITLNIRNQVSYSACSNKYDRLTLVQLFNPFRMIIRPLSARLIRLGFWYYEVLSLLRLCLFHQFLHLTVLISENGDVCFWAISNTRKG